MFSKRELPVQLAAYTLERILGSGGMAVVYLARVDLQTFDAAVPLVHRLKPKGSNSRERRAWRAMALRKLRAKPQAELMRQLRRRSIPYPSEGLCAIKALNERCTEQAAAVSRFETEWQAMIGIACPRLLEVYGGGVDEATGAHYYAMEYIDGLVELEAIGQQPAAVKLDLIIDAAEGLAALHARQLIHRDVKPQNVLVYRDGTRLRAKIADLGIAKDAAATTGMTRTGAVFGTPHFLAPEQLEGSKLSSPASDVYALGATLYAYIAGSPPFWGTSELEVMGKLFKRQRPEPLADLVPGTPPAVCELVERLMEPELAQRPEGMHEVLERARAVRASLPQPAPYQPAASDRRGIDTEGETLPEAPSPAIATPGPAAPLSEPQGSAAGAVPSQPPQRSRARRGARTSRRSQVAEPAARRPAWLPLAGGALALLALAGLAAALLGPSSPSEPARQASSSTPPPRPAYAELETKLAQLPPQLAFLEVDRFLRGTPAPSAADSALAAVRREKLLALAAELLVAPLERQALQARDGDSAQKAFDALAAADFRAAAPAIAEAAEARRVVLRDALARRLPQAAEMARRQSQNDLYAGRAQQARERLRRVEDWGVPAFADHVVGMKNDLVELADEARLAAVKAAFDRRVGRGLAHIALGDEGMLEVLTLWKQLSDEPKLKRFLARIDDPRLLELMAGAAVAGGWFKFLDSHKQSGAEVRIGLMRGDVLDVRIVEYDSRGNLQVRDAGTALRTIRLELLGWEERLRLSQPFVQQPQGVFDLMTGIVLLQRGEPRLARQRLERAIADPSSQRLARNYLSQRRLDLARLPRVPRWLPTDYPMTDEELARALHWQTLASDGKIARGPAGSPGLRAAEFAALFEAQQPTRWATAIKGLAADALGRRLALTGGDLLEVVDAATLGDRQRSLQASWTWTHIRFSRMRLFGVCLDALGTSSALFHFRGRLGCQKLTTSDGVLHDVDADWQRGVALLGDALFVGKPAFSELEDLGRANRPHAHRLVRWHPAGLALAGGDKLEVSVDRAEGGLSWRTVSEQKLLALERAGPRLVGLREDGSLQIWEPVGGQSSAGWAARAASARWPGPWRLAVHPSGLLIALGSGDGRVALIDVLTGETLRELRVRHGGAPAPTPVALSWGRLFASHGHQLHRWQLR